MTANDDGQPAAGEGGESTDGGNGSDDVVDMYGPPDGSTDPDAQDDGNGSGDGSGADTGANLDAPLLGGDDKDEMEEITGRFYVKHTEDVAVTLHDVESEQIVTLVENPGIETHQILDATLVENPPLGVSYVIEEIHSQRTIPVEYSDEPPTRQVKQLATDMDTGQAAAIEREGEGEIHILTVEPGNADEAAAELDDDETTYKNAARYGVDRVEIRTDEDDGIVSIRYLPS